VIMTPRCAPIRSKLGCSLGRSQCIACQHDPDPNPADSAPLCRGLLPNGLSQRRRAPKLPQPNQHCQRSLQLTIQVDFVPGGHVQLMRSIRDTDGLVSNGVTVLQFGGRTLVPSVPVPLDPGAEGLGGWA
jgi:hypothetical protein